MACPSNQTTNRYTTNPPATLTNLAIQWNLFGLKGRLAELQLLISQYNPLIIALQETLSPKSKLPSNYIKGYTLYIHENSSNPNINGVAIAVNSEFPHRKLSISTPLQAIAIEIDFPIKVTIISICLLSSINTHRLSKELRVL